MFPPAGAAGCANRFTTSIACRSVSSSDPEQSIVSSPRRRFSSIGICAAMRSFASFRRQPALQQALQLLLRRTPADDYAVEFLVVARLDNQRCLHHGQIGPARVSQRRKPLSHDAQNPWMKNLIQARALLRIRENDVPSLSRSTLP